jgi:hypothetical protein
MIAKPRAVEKICTGWNVSSYNIGSRTRRVNNTPVARKNRCKKDFIFIVFRLITNIDFKLNKTKVGRM